MEYTTLYDIPYEEKQDWLKITDLDNIFHIYTDDKLNKYYNINSTLYVTIPPEYLIEFICDIDSTWTLLSYRFYGTTRLAWLLMKINNVKSKDMFLLKHPGDVVYYISKENVQTIVSEINNSNQ